MEHQQVWFDDETRNYMKQFIRERLLCVPDGCRHWHGSERYGFDVCIDKEEMPVRISIYNTDVQNGYRTTKTNEWWNTTVESVLSSHPLILIRNW